MGYLHTIDAEAYHKYIKATPSPGTLLSLILYVVQQYVDKECVCLTGVPTVQICLHCNSMAHHEKDNQTMATTTVGQRKSCIQEQATPDH